ncbi:hypothetical protein F909_02615 [Acinetobacter sp. ANC 3929]|uniref:hypothetical protein n=1 Tax=unclassified Acinetobacter TaxID=196816 RepID=UPI0002D0C4BE|nr:MULTISPECIES: hypothetical protein [unclassified Acinetobacter]ENW81324.1 hypothetical protein F909_02615 [Acinetobacter sp. ANC 3929]MCH7353830.1 hypothetical protein [Acinetobacter sp. NIPH 2023]MCH7354364.1 hypothetical protein [Acinetobacter sp. NIPH 1958]MCH7361159.1 hypothetical protein [Acinetobacter sp. NIPH 2024]
MDIYLDHNVICDYISNKDEDKDLVEKIDSLLNILTLNLPYSPAHMEEVANINKSKKLSSDDKLNFIVEKLEAISKITHNYTYHPGNDEIKKTSETPFECFTRVIKDYDLTTGIAEKNQENLFCKRFEVAEEYRIKNLYDYEAEEIFESELVKNSLLKFCFNNSEIVEDLKNHDNKFHKLLFRIDNLVNFLELIGYYPDVKKNSRSNMHDISHMIYASKANYFVSNDRKMRYKAKAIYKFLNIDIKVLDKDEFINLNVKK